MNFAGSSICIALSLPVGVQLMNAQTLHAQHWYHLPHLTAGVETVGVHHTPCTPLLGRSTSCCEAPGCGSELRIYVTLQRRPPRSSCPWSRARLRLQRSGQTQSLRTILGEDELLKA